MDPPDVLKAMGLFAPVPAHEYMTRDMLAPMLDAMGVDDVPTAIAYGMLGSPEAMRGTIGPMFAKPPSEEVLNEVVCDGMAAGPDVVREVYAWLLSNLEPQLGDVRVPTLIVAGVQDTIRVDDTRRTANGIKRCRFEVREDAGRFPPVETPHKVADLLTSFIKEVSMG